MPNRRLGAPWAPCHRSPTLPGARTLIRAGIGALVAASLLTVPGAISPPPASAACGTGWDSKLNPPRTIRVLRTRSGNVQRVGFRRYVAEVMASGEWPTWMPRAALEVGAVATKQYAWYHALQGHHRRGYRTPGGECYDVRDDTIDQLYRPERARPTRKQERAIEATWGLSLRKRGRFFLTGYRQGSTGRCAADADGWHVYSRSVTDCAADRGWSRARIQNAYYRPSFETVWAPGFLGPAVSTPRVRLTPGTSLRSGFATVSWRALTPAGRRRPPTIARYELQHRVGDGRWKDVTLPHSNATSVRLALELDRGHRFRVRATDARGDRGPWTDGTRWRARVRGPRDMTLSGSWAVLVGDQDDTVRIRFRGRSFAYLAPTGPGMGSADIKLNGKVVARVDLESSSRRDARLVWTRNWKRERLRTVVVRALHTGERVEVDGFLLLS